MITTVWYFIYKFKNFLIKFSKSLDMHIVVYNGYKNEYENTKCIELTKEEKVKINKKLVDEIECYTANYSVP